MNPTTDTQVVIPTADGECPAHLLKPAAEGRWPAVIFYGDAGGIRPAMVAMARRIAEAGYLVLLPDPFYRYGPYEPLVPRDVFAGDVMAILGPLMATTGNRKAGEDTGAYLRYLDALSSFNGTDGAGTGTGKLGAVGFCMGGGMAITAAACFPDRFAAVATFHGGNLATDDPESPHLRAAELQGELYVAAAENDDTYPPAMAERLEAALLDAGSKHTTETYAGAAHGWMVPDFPTHDPESAERGWASLLALFERTLKR